jgi:hypothetical protein
VRKGRNKLKEIFCILEAVGMWKGIPQILSDFSVIGVFGDCRSVFLTPISYHVLTDINSYIKPQMLRLSHVVCFTF